MTTLDVPGHEPLPTRVWLVPLVVSLGAVATSAALQWSWRDELPEHIATHFGSDGTPDGWSSLTGNIIFTICFGLLVSAFLLGVGLAVKQGRQMAAVSSGTAVFLVTVMTWVVGAQRGSEGAAQDVPVGPGLFVALAAGLVAGLLVWWVVRRRGPQPVAHGGLQAGAPVIAAGEDIHRVWARRVRRSRPSLVAQVLLCSIVPAMAVGFLVAGDPWLAAFLLVVSLVVVVPVSMMFATVTVDRRGVQARALGARWVDIPLETITSAQVERYVNPLGGFGGWGVRGGFDGTRGLVTAEGEGVRIHRAGQPDWVITVDDAEGAAATINTLVARRRG